MRQRYPWRRQSPVLGSDQAVLILSTATGAPSSGELTLTLAGIAYNSAVAPAGPFALTLGAGTFTVAISGLKTGLYDIGYSVKNANYEVAGGNALGTIDIADVILANLTQTLNGQELVLIGHIQDKFDGVINVAACQLLVPAAAANPKGAIDQVAQGSVAVLADGAGKHAFHIAVDLPPGHYDPGILTFVTDGGTSLPMSDTRAVTILGLDGNPVVPGANDPADPANPTDPQPDTQKTVTLILRDGAGEPISNLTGLKYAVYDQPTPDLSGPAVAQGALGTINSIGAFSVSYTSSLPMGGLGRIEITESDGTVAQDPAPRCWTGVVQVA